jgi:transcriptional regulator with XRE-family HTH domain
MVSAADVLRNARRSSGLTQAELARRAGIAQSEIARLERPGANPTLATMERVLHAAGHALELGAKPTKSSIDDTLVARNLRMSPAERLAAFQSSYSNIRRLVQQVRGSNGELA